MAPKRVPGWWGPPEGLTCDLAFLLPHVTAWHRGIEPPHLATPPVTPDALSSVGGCIIV